MTILHVVIIYVAVCMRWAGPQQKADTKRSKFSLDSDSSSEDEDKKDRKSDSSLSDDDADDNDNDDDNSVDSDGWDDSDSDRNPFAKGSDSDDGICQIYIALFDVVFFLPFCSFVEFTKIQEHFVQFGVMLYLLLLWKVFR